MNQVNRLIIAILVTAAIAAITTIAALWAWNTLAGLFHWPDAGYRHVLAAFLLLATLRFALRGRKKRHGRRNAGYTLKAGRPHGT